MWIDEFETDWLEKLDRCASRLLPGRQLYLLIDGVFVPGLWRRFASQLGSAPVSLLFKTLPGCSEAVSDASPFLVRYAPGNRVMANLLGACNRWPMVSAVETSETLEQLSARLAAWCIIENDGQRFNFRFPDTRRLPGLVNALSPQQRAEFAGAAKCWHYVNRKGQWDSLHFEGHACPVKQRPQRLEDSQFALMVEDSAVDEMIVRLEYRGYRPGIRPSEMYAIVEQALAVASSRELDIARAQKWAIECLRRGAPMEQAQAFAEFEQWCVRAA